MPSRPTGWWTRRTGAVVSTIAAGALLVGAVTAVAAEPGPSLNLTDGQVVSGVVDVTATGEGETTVTVDDQPLETAVEGRDGTLRFTTGSLEGGKYKDSVWVNGTNVRTFTSVFQGDGVPDTEIPAGLLRAGSNTVTFRAGSATQEIVDYADAGTPSTVDYYLVRNLRIELADGTSVRDNGFTTTTKAWYVGKDAIDPATKDAGTTELTFTFELPEIVKPAAGSWDTTTVADGPHTVTATDGNGVSTSVDVNVDNVPLWLSVADGATVEGDLPITVAGGNDPEVAVDGFDVPITPASTEAMLRFTTGSLEGGKYKDSVWVNGTNVRTFTSVFQSDGVPDTEIPAGLLRAGSNTVTFRAGSATQEIVDYADAGTPSTVDYYLVRNLRIELADGTSVRDNGFTTTTKSWYVGKDAIDPATKDAGTTELTFTFELGQLPTPLEGTWDSTTVSDGEHTVTATDSTGATLSRTVEVDNLNPTPLFTEDAVFSGVTGLSATGAPDLAFKADGEELPATIGVPAGHFRFIGGSLEGNRFRDSVWLNGELLQEFTTLLGSGNSPEIAIPANLLEVGDNVITFRAGSHENLIEPDEATQTVGLTDGYSTWNVRFDLSDGTTLRPTGYTTPTRQSVVGEGFGTTSLDYHFVIPEERTTAEWDTTTVADGYHTVTLTGAGETQDFRVIVDNQPLTLGLTNDQTVRGEVEVAANGDDDLTFSVDGGSPVAAERIPAGGRVVADLQGDFDGLNYHQSVWVNGTMLPELKQVAGDGRPGSFEIAPGLLQPGENTIRMRAGNAQTATADPGQSVRSWAFSNVRVALADGRVVTPKDVDPATQHTVNTATPYVDFTVTLPENIEPFVYAWDTSAVDDGPHTVKVSDVSGSKSVSVAVDNHEDQTPLTLAVDTEHALHGTVPVYAVAESAVTATVDGDSLPLKQSEWSGIDFAHDVYGYDGAAYLNSVWVNGEMLPRNKFQNARYELNLTPTSSAIPDGLLRVGTNTILVRSGSEYDFVDTERENDRYDFRDPRLVLPGGKVIRPTSADRDRVYRLLGTEPYLAYEFTFELDADQEPYEAQWDTGTVPDGEHTIVATTGSDEPVTATVRVDNTAPVLSVTSPVDGQHYQGTQIEFQAGAADPVDGAVDVALTLDGAPVAVGARIHSDDLTNGSHTLVATAEDSTGNEVSQTIGFSTVVDAPDPATDPAPADGTEAVPPATTNLAVTVADPAGDELDVAFRLAESVDFAGSGVAARSGTTQDGEPDFGTGDVYAPADLTALAAADGESVGSQAEGAYPYQQFDLEVPDDLAAGRKYDVTWTGTAPEGQRVVMSVWDRDADTWVELSSADGGTDEVTLTGKASPASTVSGSGEATVMVQARPAYIGASEQGRTRFAWMTDTQGYSQDEPGTYDKMTQWVVDHAESDKIAYTIHTGDIVNVVDQEFQWVNASASMKRLDDANLAYGVVSGNHDYESGYAHYTRYFGKDRYAGNPWYVGSSDDNVQHADLVSTPEADYLFVYLTWSASGAEWQWVKDMIESHPDANVILGTHEQFADTGQLTGQGKRFMQEIILPYPNVRAILSGHKQTSYVWVHHLANGRVVLQVQGNYQSVRTPYSKAGGGYMRTLDLDIDSQTFKNKTFSVLDPTSHGAWPNQDGDEIKDENFTKPVTISTITRSFSTDYVGLTAKTTKTVKTVEDVASGDRVEVPAGKLASEAGYRWYVDVTDDGGHTTSSDVWSFSTGDSAGTQLSAADVSVDSGAAAQVEAMVTPVDATGEVEFTIEDGPSCTAEVAAGGVARCSLDARSLTPGDYEVAVSYAGDTTYASSSTSFTLTVASADPLAPIVVAPPIVSGTPEVGATLTATPATYIGEPTSVTGQWLADGGPIAGQTGTTLRVTASMIGTSIRYRSVATKTGVDGAVTSESAPLGPVAKLDATLTGRARATTYGKPGEVVVRLTPPDGIPTLGGEVTLSGVGAPMTRSAGASSVTFRLPATLAPGSYAATVTYSGDRAVNSATDSLRVVVAKRKPGRPALRVTTAPAHGKPGRATVTLDAPRGLAAASGKVTLTLKKGARTKRVSVTLRRGRAGLRLPALDKGRWKVTVTYRGDAHYQSQPGKPVRITVR